MFAEGAAPVVHDSADSQFVTLWLKEMYPRTLYSDDNYIEEDAWSWAGRLESDNDSFVGQPFGDNLRGRQAVKLSITRPFQAWMRRRIGTFIV